MGCVALCGVGAYVLRDRALPLSSPLTISYFFLLYLFLFLSALLLHVSQLYWSTAIYTRVILHLRSVGKLPLLACINSVSTIHYDNITSN
jgi:hypothetical protein